MYYFLLNEAGVAVAAVEELSAEYRGTKNYTYRGDFKNFQRAVEIAEQITAATGELYLPVDNTANVSPRYDVIRAPAVGDEVSYAFNGDYYPCGKIVKISPTYKKITTDTGNTFYRTRLNSANWKMDGTWSLVRGHIERQNPCF